jgi:RNA polymerase sigma factor (sigma-70 family)
MTRALPMALNTPEQDRELTATVRRERQRLWNFIRRRVRDDSDAEDILQDVFGELIEAYRLLVPIEQVGAWLVRIARNRIIDRFRKRRPQAELEPGWEELLPALDGGPDEAHLRGLWLDELSAALAELPAEQRDVFIAHELDGRSFRELAADTGLSINTLLARKRYAVLRLRARLRALHEQLDDL